MSPLHSPQPSRRLAALCVLGLAAGMTACGRIPDNRTAEATETNAQITVRDDGAETLRSVAQEPTSQPAAQWYEVRSEAGDRVADAAITASVNAELARDDDLSALRIDVDANNGHVMLKGTAPTAASRERAARIASNVRGVTSVDNQLVVEP